MEAWGKMDTQKKIAVIVIAAIVLIGGFLIFRNFNNSSSNNETGSSISGTFNINGVIPDGATITIYASEYDASKPDVASTNVVAEGLTAEDGGTWSFSDLPTGQTYMYLLLFYSLH